MRFRRQWFASRGRLPVTTSSSAVGAASLLLRLGVGTVFLFAGLEKVARGTEFTTAYFSSLGVPLPELMAPVISWFELIGGACLLLGLATLLFAVLFALEMLFVILFIRLPEASTAFSLVDAFLTVRLEMLLVLAATAIALLGSGRWSMDFLIRRRLSGRRLRTDGE